MAEPSLNILMTADAVGGVWTYALDLAAGLAGHGVRTTLAVFGPQPSVDQRASAARIDGLAVVETGLPLDWTATTVDEVLAGAHAVTELADALEVDLVHLNSPVLAAAGPKPKAPRVAVAHSCVATWWRAVRTGPLPSDFAWRAGLIRRGYMAADRLVAPSAAFAAATAATYALPRPPAVVHNGRRASAEGGTDPAPAAGFAFTAGRLWDEGKNLAALDRAAARLAVPVYAAGPTRGPNGAAVELRSVRPLGVISDEDLQSRLAQRPIFVSAALYEPFGLAVLEAAQAGCPLVLSDIPTFRELWDGAAAFVPPRDDHALAVAVEALSRHPARAAELGRAARERASAYGAERMVAQTLGIYRAVLGGEAAAA